MRVHAANSRLPVPDNASLVLTSAKGEKREHLTRREAGVFALPNYRIDNDVTYRIETIDATSGDFKITAIERVSLAKDSPKIAVTLPQYAQHSENTALRPVLSPGLVDVKALQYSTAKFEVAFTRPAVAAYVEFIPNTGEKPVLTRLTLADDRRSGVLNDANLLTLKTDGRYRLILEAEYDIRTEIDGGKISVIVDQPPHFVARSVKIGAKEEPKTVLPYDRIPVQAKLRDDVGTGRLELEFYRVAKDAPEKNIVVENIPLPNAGRLTATAKWEWQLGNLKLKEGDKVVYRLRGQDDRTPEFGGPQSAYYPRARQHRVRKTSG